MRHEARAAHPGFVPFDSIFSPGQWPSLVLLVVRAVSPQRLSIGGEADAVAAHVLVEDLVDELPLHPRLLDPAVREPLDARRRLAAQLVDDHAAASDLDPLAQGAADGLVNDAE